MIPNFTTTKEDKTFNFYLIDSLTYENGLDYSVEQEVLYFEDEVIEMDGYTSDMTEDDEISLYKRMNCSSSTIELIRTSEYVIVTSITKI